MLYLGLENIRSLHNIGSAFRTCDGFNVDKIMLCGYSACPPHQDISKTALGAEQVVDFEKHSEILTLINQLKNDGFDIVALEKTKYSEDIKNFKWPKKTFLIVGNEISGVSPTTLEKCDYTVHIFMGGIKESYNVASALAIALYDWNSKL